MPIALVRAAGVGPSWLGACPHLIASASRVERGWATMTFADRVDAGQQLSRLVSHLRRSDLVVLGRPRGGVPVAFEVAQSLQAPLDVILVRKLGVPDQPELGVGAIGEGGVRVINPDVVGAAGVTADELAAIEAKERTVLSPRADQLRGNRLPCQKLLLGLTLRFCGCGQAAQWYSLRMPPRTRRRRRAASIDTTHPDHGRVDVDRGSDVDDGS